MRTIGFLLCTWAILAAGALRAEKLRIPEGEAVKTDAAYLAEKAVPFYTRHLVDSFDPAAIAAKERIPDIVAVRNALALRYAAGNRAYCGPAMREKAQALVKGGCKDAGVALMQAERDSVAANDRLKSIDAALAELQKAEKPDAVLMAMLRMSAFVLKADDAREKAFCESLASAFACSDGFAQADPRIALRLLKPVKRNKKHPAGIFTIQMPDPWIQMILRGNDLGTEAFDARGRGLAYTVTDEGWKGFAEKNTTAYRLLEAAHSLHPQWPDAAAELADLAHHAKGKPALYWLNKTLAASFDVPEAVKRHAHFSTSRWCGSTEGIVALAKACMRTKRYDSLLPFAGMRIVFETIPAYEMGLPEAAEAWLRQDRELFDLIYATAEGYLDEPEHPQTGPRDFYARAGIVAALFDGDWAKARSFADRLTTKKQIFQDWPFFRSMSPLRMSHCYFPATQALINGRFPADIARAESLAASGKTDEALALFKEIRTRKNATEADCNYCDARFFTLRARAGMKSGEWFSLMPTPSGIEGMSFWTRCKVENGIVRGRNNTQSVQCSATPLPDDCLEFAGTIHFLPNEKQKKWEAGWTFNHIYDCATYIPEFQFVRENGRDTLHVKKRTKPYKTIALEGTPATRDFRAVIKNGRFVFEVDGKTVVDDAQEEMTDPDICIYLGGNCCLPVIHMNVNTGIGEYRCRTLPGWDRGRPWSSPAFHD